MRGINMSEDNKIIVPEELAKEYARIKRVSLEQAYANLEANIKKESEGVDLSQQYQTLIKAFRTMSPQLSGVIAREDNITAEMKVIRADFAVLRTELTAMQDRLDFERELYSQALKLISEIKTPLYLKLWNRIKCLLKL